MTAQLNMLVPKYLEINFRNGRYVCHGKCLIKLAKTKQWRKAIMHGSAGYESYVFEIEACPEYPEGLSRSLSTDHRWNDEDVSDIRLVPDEMWDLPIQQDKLTETEILTMNLKKRLDAGEKVHDSSRASEARDWKIVQVGNDSKYGCVAYSPSLDIMRKQTFDEFYGGGIVD